MLTEEQIRFDRVKVLAAKLYQDVYGDASSLHQNGTHTRTYTGFIQLAEKLVDIPEIREAYGKNGLGKYVF